MLLTTSEGKHYREFNAYLYNIKAMECEAQLLAPSSTPQSDCLTTIDQLLASRTLSVVVACAIISHRIAPYAVAASQHIQSLGQNHDIVACSDLCECRVQI